jgi:hypothetical protein
MGVNLTPSKAPSGKLNQAGLNSIHGINNINMNALIGNSKTPKEQFKKI